MQVECANPERETETGDSRAAIIGLARQMIAWGVSENKKIILQWVSGLPKCRGSYLGYCYWSTCVAASESRSGYLSSMTLVKPRFRFPCAATGHLHLHYSNTSVEYTPLLRRGESWQRLSWKLKYPDCEWRSTADQSSSCLTLNVSLNFPEDILIRYSLGSSSVWLVAKNLCLNLPYLIAHVGIQDIWAKLLNISETYRNRRWGLRYGPCGCLLRRMWWPSRGHQY